MSNRNQYRNYAINESVKINTRVGDSMMTADQLRAAPLGTVVAASNTNWGDYFFDFTKGADGWHCGTLAATATINDHHLLTSFDELVVVAIPGFW